MRRMLSAPMDAIIKGFTWATWNKAPKQVKKKALKQPHPIDKGS